MLEEFNFSGKMEIAVFSKTLPASFWENFKIAAFLGLPLGELTNRGNPHQKGGIHTKMWESTLKTRWECTAKGEGTPEPRTCSGGRRGITQYGGAYRGLVHKFQRFRLLFPKALTRVLLVYATWLCPATRNRARDHLITVMLYSQMLCQLSYSRIGDL